jgi:hypothetical protein
MPVLTSGTGPATDEDTGPELTPGTITTLEVRAMNRDIPTRDRYPRPIRPACRSGRHQLRRTLSLLEDRMLLAIAPQTYLVTNPNDSGPGSLRAAIASANADTYFGPAFDTINFAGTLTAQTIDLTTVGDSTHGSSALAITAPIRIDAYPLAGVAIARSPAVGTPDMRIFYVASGGNLTLNNLTILGGQDLSTAFGGGGILSFGKTMLTNDTFSANFATNGGAFENDGGSATLTDDNFSFNFAYGDGGGVFNFFSGTATLTNDTFTGNSATFGGGLLNNGSATLLDNTFSGNSGGNGGGIDNVNVATVSSTNDTFAGNSASNGGGLFHDGLSAALTGDTFAGNSASNDGGGLSANLDTPVTLNDTIVAGNYITGGSYSTMPSDMGAFTPVTGSYNLVGDPKSAGGLTEDVNGNIVGYFGLRPLPISTIFATDSSGVPLVAFYGGPTQTVALVPGSPALDAGSSNVPGFQHFDQRGLPRVGAPDIGAFESQGFKVAVAGGNNQATPVDQFFASPLSVTVTPINPIEPVNGGTVFFEGPDPIDFASASFLPNNPATIVNGTASVTALANDNSGPYIVGAVVSPSNGIAFQLTNQSFAPANIQADINAAPPGGITLQPTTLTPLNVILTTLADLGPQASTARVTVSLPKTMSPYSAIMVNLPAGLNFTLDGNGSSVSGDVTIRQHGGADTTVNNLNVTGDLRIKVGNADNGSVVVTQSNVSGNVEIHAGNGDADSVTISGLSVGGDAEFETGNGNADRISISGLSLGRCGNAEIETGNGKADAITADALVLGGDLQIETGNGDGDSVAVTAISGPTTISDDTEIELGNGAGDTATVTGSNGATFNDSFDLEMGNGATLSTSGPSRGP